MRDPGELVAALPFLIGFRPRDSLLLVAFGGPSGRRIGLTQRVDLPPPEDAAPVCAALAGNLLTSGPAGAAVLVVGGDAAAAGAVAYGAVPPHADLVEVATAAVEGRGVPVQIRAWAAATDVGAAWACYDECRCRGALPDPATTPLAATAVAAGLMVHADRTDLERLVAPAAPEVLRRRERLLTGAVEAALAEAAPRSGPADGDRAAPREGAAAAEAVVDAALADTVAGRLRLDDDRVVALALALSDPLVRDAALVRCAEPRFAGVEQLWAALARETPDPEAAEPAALLAACALLRGDGALAGVALDRAEEAWPGHRLSALLRAAWAAGMRPEQVRECLRTAPVPRPGTGGGRRARRRGRR
jgi:Domain of unknown function (DUF4192)